jgi:uncharacterized LabA/DUF88 family protein
MTDPRLRLAVFIDFDNIEIGVRSTLQASFDAGIVLEALRERGDVVSKTAYSDWQRAGGYSRVLTQHAIKMVQRNLTPGGDKNGADINLALDALEMAFTHPHINAFVIVGGDSDFISLVEKLKQYDKKVFVVGGRQFTSAILQRNCHEFIAYENLVGAGAGGGAQRSAGRAVRVERMPLEQVIPLVLRALAVLSEREVSPQLGVFKSTLLQLDSTFSERNYGAGSFRDFVEKLAKAGAVRIYQAKGGWMVGAPDGPVAGAETADEETPARPEEADRESPPRAAAAAATAIATAGTTAEGLEIFRTLIASAQGRRWPMYVRHIKQLCRQASPSFDERAYGYSDLMDLLRAGQKEGVIRLERDRQGVVRVFQSGAPAAAPPASRPSAAEPEMTAPVPAAEPERPPDDADLSVGPGNSASESPPATEVPRRRRRTAAPRAAGAGARRPRRKTP